PAAPGATTGSGRSPSPPTPPAPSPSRWSRDLAPLRCAAQGATAAHGNCLTRLFPLVYVRVAVPASCGAPWAALAFCDRCPCSASLHPPQAALGSAALRQNFTSNRALVTSFLAHNLP